MREAVGPDVELIIEAHDRFDVVPAIRIGRRLEPYRIGWYEAPVHSADVEALVRVAGEVPLPVGAGERFSQPGQFVRARREPDAADVAAGNAQHRRRLGNPAGRGARIGVRGPIAIHNARGPVCTAVNAHLAAWMPNFRIQEVFDETIVPLAYEVVRGTPRIVDGCLEVPSGPGLGVELDEAAAARYP